jgi:hypothetical protein
MVLKTASKCRSRYSAPTRFSYKRRATFTGQPHNLIFPSIPNNLISQPTLLWSGDRQLPESKKRPISPRLNWKADYVAADSKDKN